MSISSRRSPRPRWSGWRPRPRPLVPEPNAEHNPDMQLNVLRTHSDAGRIEFLKAISAK